MRDIESIIRRIPDPRAVEELMAVVRDMSRMGPDTPDNDMVICPNCTSQFRAIPVNVQRELAEARELLSKTAEWLRDPRWGTWPYMEGSEVYDDKANAIEAIDAFLAATAKENER